MDTQALPAYMKLPGLVQEGCERRVTVHSQKGNYQLADIPQFVRFDGNHRLEANGKGMWVWEKIFKG